MDEQDILALLLRHDEDGLDAALKQYGKRLRAIAAGIVGVESAEECVNDTLLNAWNAIPPEQPTHLRAYLCKLTRNIALNRYAQESAKKRGGTADDNSAKRADTGRADTARVPAAAFLCRG
ncbi:MAG: RNA polymerase sigma factor [Faecousia sp.]